MRHTQYKNHNQHVLFNQNALTDFPDTLFDINPTHVSHTCTDAQGRGTVIFFEHDNRQMVLKRYHRGGLIGRFVKDTYLFSGLKKVRMWREFELLGQMRDLGLPVPRPIAARCVRGSLLTYQGEVVLERIPEARTLAEILCDQPLSDKTWEAVGLIIRRFHQHNIDHADLNACNILLNPHGQIFLIDFDKSCIRSQLDHSWRMSNLSRLRRSLQKWARKQEGFNFRSSHWHALERGYQGTASAPVRARANASLASR